MTERKKNLFLFWEDGTPRSSNNAFTSSGYEPTAEERKREIAAKGGYASVASKLAQGMPLIPKLHLKGSTPRTKRMRVKEPA